MIFPKIRRIKQQIYDASGLSVLSSFENNMEVTSQKAKKGIMLKQAMKHFGFFTRRSSRVWRW